ncbi:hypothetical protein [Streptosporangium sp. CA-115845]|uniref:hypothetical protein n=1 Tax=Streptosporangium sp. CA-115845 TaxID=3240071 RepID=UPI003D94F8D6
MPVQHIERHDPINEGAPGLVDLIVTLTDEEAALLGGDAMAAGESAHLAAWALILLRTLERDGTFTSRYSEEGSTGDTDNDLASLRGIIVALDRTVLPRLHGIRDAAVRAHQDRGGSYGQLAAAMNVARSTAQTRADALAAQEPSAQERWARGLEPLVRPSSSAPAGLADSPAFAEFMRIADRNQEARAAVQPRMDALVARHQELDDACEAAYEELRAAREDGDGDQIAAAETAHAEAYRVFNTEGLAAIREHTALAEEQLRRGDELNEASRRLFRPA